MNKRQTFAWILWASLSFATAIPTPSAQAMGTSVPRTYSDVRGELHRIQSQYSRNVRVFELGMSDSGQMIEGLAIGDGPAKNLVVAAHHGNEYASTAVAQALARSLAQNPIPDQTVYVVPVLNVSGFDARNRWEVVDGQPYDPNRDYPGPCGTEGPFYLKSTAALAQFVESEEIVAAATLHTFFPAVVYPWGLTSEDLSTPYDDLFKELARLATQESHYQIGNSTEVVYAANGTFEDYVYWKHGVWSLLFELGYSHKPSDSDVEQTIKVNVPGLRRMLEKAPKARASQHDFTGRCQEGLYGEDRHEE